MCGILRHVWAHLCDCMCACQYMCVHRSTSTSRVRQRAAIMSCDDSPQFLPFLQTAHCKQQWVPFVHTRAFWKIPGLQESFLVVEPSHPALMSVSWLLDLLWKLAG